MNSTTSDNRFEFRLDNAAKIYVSQLSKRRTTIFRLGAKLKEPINLTRLEEAYGKMLDRCPYFQVHLRRGLFWYYLEPQKTIPRIEAESRYPCLYIPFKKIGVTPFRLIAYKNSISFEVAHFITDGSGAMAFLNGILLEYLRLSGHQIASEGKILDCLETMDEEEFEEGFKKHYQKGTPAAKMPSPAWQIPGKPVSPPAFWITEGILDSKALQEKAKEYDVTIGMFLTALLIDTCKIDMAEQGKKFRPIRISVPINLRRFIPSRTMRNFSLTAEPGIDPRLGEFSFEEIIQKVHLYMQIELDSKYIGKQIARNIEGEQNPLIRVVPLLLKVPILRFFYSRIGSRIFTMSFSNLGRVNLPGEMVDLVDSYQMIPPPHKGKISATSIAFNGKTRFFFSSTLQEKRIERIFFNRLRKMGLSVTIRTNRS